MSGLLNQLQRATSNVPGVAAFKRMLRDDLTACGIAYQIFAARAGRGFTMLTYHCVLEQPDPFYLMGVHAPVFESHLAFLRRFANVLALDEVLDRLDAGRALPPRCVVITFDDGYRDNLTTAWPLLQRHGLPATLFVAIEAIECGLLWPDLLSHAMRHTKATQVELETLRGDAPSTFEWDGAATRSRLAHELLLRFKRLPDAARRQALAELTKKLLGRLPEQVRAPRLMLSWEELRRLADEGMTIGAHTRTHPVLTRLAEAQALEEIVASREQLEHRLGRPVRHFAYPFGTPSDWSQPLARLVERAGFRSACTTVSAVNAPGTDRFLLSRVSGTQGSVRALVRAMTEEALVQ